MHNKEESFSSDELGLFLLEKLEEERRLLEDEYQSEYRAGAKGALWDTLIACAERRVAIPEWASQELITINSNLRTGEIYDLNTALGHEHKNPLVRKKEAKFWHYWVPLLRAVRKESESGRGVERELITEVGESLGLTEGPARDCYDFGKEFIWRFSHGDDPRPKRWSPRWSDEDSALMDAFEKAAEIWLEGRTHSL